MRFDSSHIGQQAFGAEDEAFRGSLYSEVKAAMFQNAYYLNWGSEYESPLPVYDVTLGRVLRGILPGGRLWQFKAATARTLDSSADLRWGPDRRGFRRLLHPNGIALFGRWIIDEDNPFSGYFEKGSEALVVGRYSTCCTETRRGYNRSLSLVAKLYPTTDEKHTTPLQTADFITQQDFGGERTPFINDAVLRNAPDTTPWRRGLGTPVLLLTGVTFMLVETEPTIRQVYPIAELGKPKHRATNAPQFMQLSVDASQPRIRGDELDFRDEILAQIYDHGNPKPQRRLVFNIDVTNDGYTRGKLIQRRTFSNWQRIGRIEFTEAVASYNADFVLHFHHPPWRRNRNDPHSLFRQAK